MRAAFILFAQIVVFICMVLIIAMVVGEIGEVMGEIDW